MSRPDAPDRHAASIAAADWYRGPLGRLVAAELVRALSDRAQTAFGYHALVLGETAAVFHERFDWARQLRVGHVHMAGRPGGEGALLPVEPDALPIESEAVDLVIALHLLEDRRNPHEILREIDRTLRPEGRLMLVGVNPASLLHLRSRFWPGCHAPLGGGTHHPAWRVVDWLRLLGYRIDAIEPVGGIAPWCRAGMYARCERLRRWSADWAWFLHGLYVIDATRRVSMPTRSKPVFRFSSLVGRPVRGEVAGMRRADDRMPFPLRRDR